MRLAICTLSAVLLSGCSWMGTGAGNSGSYGYGAGANCAPGQYGQVQYGQAGAYNLGAGGCGPAGGYGVAGNGYGQGAGAYGAGGYGYGQGAGANGYGAGAGAYGAGMNGYGAGANGYGAGAGMAGYGAGANGYGQGAGGALGLRGAQGAGAYGAGGGMYGANGYGPGGTVLGGAAPYGSAVGGQVIGGGGYAGGGQMINGQWVQGGAAYGGGTVQTVRGAPIYVPQPYPAYYGVGVGGGMRGASAAMPFGIEANVGTEFGIGGDIFGAKPAGLASGSLTRSLSASPAISYKDAYENGVGYDLAATYDVDPSTTLIGRIGYQKAEGQRVQIGNVTDTTFPGVDEPYYATWSDMEQVTLEGGVRKYMGGWNNGVSGVRPYIGATAGFTHNDEVSVVQDSATIMNPADPAIVYTDAGWTPTAAGTIGAEMQVGRAMAIGVETGIRWRDDLNTVTPSDDRWSVPLKLRGRVSF